MDISSLLQAIEQRLARLERQVNGQLLGNNPSTNYKQVLYQGGGQAGWFQLTNNGVNTIINNATDNTTTPPVQLSLQSQTVGGTSYAGVGPTEFILADSTTPAVVAILYNNTGVGHLELDSLSSTAQVTSDNVTTTWTGTGTHTPTLTATATQIQFLQRLVGGSATFTFQHISFDDGVGDVTTIQASGSTIVAPVITGGISISGGLTVSTGNFAVTLGTISGAHLQNLGTTDSPTFNDLAITGYASLATELASLQSQINALSAAKADHGTYAGTVTGATCSTTI